MKLSWPGAAMLTLCSCTSKTSHAEKEYEIISSRGTLGEQCEKAREVQADYLHTLDVDGYDRWKAAADVDCYAAGEYGASLPANDKERAKLQSRINAADINATDMNATMESTDDALKTASDAVRSAKNAIDNAKGPGPQDGQDANVDAGE